MIASAARLPSSPGLISISGLDHVVLRVRDLDRAETLYRSLGFALTPRGFHTGRGSANHTAVFRSGTYIELIWSPEGDVHSPFGARPEGPVAVALQPLDSHVVHGELLARGFDIPPPRDLSRPVDGGDGDLVARFINVSLPDIGPPGLRLFACQHLTRPLVWRPGWLDHANGVQGVERVIVVDPDPSAFQTSFDRLFGTDAVSAARDGLLIELGKQRIDILSQKAFEAQFPSLSARFEDGFHFVGLTLRTASIDRAATTLSEAGVPHLRPDDRRVVLRPAETGGTLIELVEGRSDQPWVD